MGRQKCALRVVVFGVVVLCGLVTPVTAFHCPEQVNTIVLPAEEAHSVAVSEGYAYTTHCDTRNGGERAFRVFDVRTASNPVEVGSFEMCAGGFVVSGRYAFVNRLDPVYNGVMDVRVIDVSDPTSPDEVGVLQWVGGVAAVSDGYAYAVETCRLRVIDLTNPISPVEVGFLDLSWCDRLSGLTISGNFAYVTSRRFGEGYLHVVDVSDPSALVEVGEVAVTEDSCFGVAVSGDYAYVASSNTTGFYESGISVINVSDPSAPVVTAYVDLSGGGGSALAASGHALYVARTSYNNFGHFMVFDVSDPSAPSEMGSLSEAYFWVGEDLFLLPFAGLSDIDIVGRYVYAVGQSGLFVLDTWGCRHPYQNPDQPLSVIE